MPTKKIADDTGWKQKLCRDPGHNPPSHMVYEPGAYEHTCPKCNRKLIFTVQAPSWSSLKQVIEGGSKDLYKRLKEWF